MAALAEPSSSSTPLPEAKDRRPVVVRVKRKADQERFDAFWLEINERPEKRRQLDLEALSISDSSGKKDVSRRLLLQRVETVKSFKAVRDVLESYLPNISGSKDVKTRIEERKNTLKLDKQKQEQLRMTARQKHEDLLRSARFEQVWRSRRGKMKGDDDSLREICHLYDVVQVDTEDKNSRKAQMEERISLEDHTILCNYLPLLREYISSAAEEIESDIRMYTFGKVPLDGGVSEGQLSRTEYVYDLYTVEDDANGIADDTTFAYPLVQVNEEDDFYDGPSDSEYATDDSNAEDNPMNDYPDEESSGDEEEETFDPLDEAYDSQYADEVVSVSDDDEDWRWKHR